MPMNMHLEITGEKSGQIRGSCDMRGREDTILVYGFEHKVHIPRDPQSGLPSGKRVHSPFVITKEFDVSSPLILRSLCSGEHLTVKLKWYRVDPRGTGVEEHYFTHELTKAIVVEFRPYTPLVFLPENEPYRHMEQVCFTYKKIKATWEDGGIEAEDDWKEPWE